jgi:5-methylcytosine-specific restriction endonuclease McrA
MTTEALKKYRARNIDWSTIFQEDTKKVQKEIDDIKEARKKKYKAKNKMLKETVYRKLGNRCSSCGIIDERVLEVHHIDPSKKIKGHGTNYELYLKEIHLYNNLTLLCCNCHRIETLKQSSGETSG